MMEPHKPMTRRQATPFLLLAALGIALVLYASRFGLGTTGDSVHYLMGAENLLEGQGFGRTTGNYEVRTITMFAPFFSTVMAGFGLTGFLLEATRFLQALLFGASIFLLALITFRMTGSTWAAMIGGSLLLLSKDVVLFHFWLMPEALYIFLSLLVLLLLGSYLETGHRRVLFLTAIVAGMATVTRYVGVALVATSVISILLLRSIPWKRRVGESLLAGAIGLAPFVYWIGRNLVASGDPVNRAIGYHPISAELIRAYRAQISYWFAPEVLNIPHVLRRALMVLLGIIVPGVSFGLDFRDTFLKREGSRRSNRALPWVLLLYAVIYVITFILNLTFLDALRDFNTVPRYLTPLLVIAIPLYVTALHGLVKRKMEWRVLRPVALLLAGGFVTMYALQTLPMVRDPIPDLGYTGIKLERPETVHMLDSLNQSAPIISNDPELVFILSNRPAFVLPIRYDANTGKEREDFGHQLQATREKLDAGGMLVLFSPIREHEMEVIDLLGVDLIDSFYGSQFYAYPQAIED